ncbi:threonine transporter RhtB [Streptomyces spinoverrucosus]|uniref:Threonine transporter RhtB n=1 Tax=Streptomyces spinoverrucosus TaxID=284043 RepID=A0A4Y3VTV8_9ACTN|nr:LysE family translocator [Streptomyces spinoverrucosus]GEC10424.1 threonine transporter RhtB [Streptomyces spinoverrucosus]GHB48752.1 threonine transporter RhtB [Streptomyces spinoverrucosus]
MLGLSWAQLGSFVVLCLVLAATPGANLTVVLGCARQGGQRAAIAATVGLTLGKVFWAAGSVLGLATLLATSRVAYDVLRLAGAAYLIWLGVQALRSARRRPAVQPPDGLMPELSALGGFRRGLIGDLLNPKVGIFYTTVFPQFIGPDDAVVPAAAALLAAHTAVLMTWYPGMSYLLTRVGRRLARPGLSAVLDGVMGSALIGLGIRLAIVPL